MRIGNGPRLVVPRPGQTGYRGYYSRWVTRGQAYDLYRRTLMDRLRKLPKQTAGDVKPQAVYPNSLKVGEHYRLVDGHGRARGKRLTLTDLDDKWLHWPLPLVRRVDRQDEDYHSRVSRILKAAHRRMLRED